MPSWSEPVRNEEFLTPTIWIAQEPKDSESNSQPATADGAFACEIHEMLLSGPALDFQKTVFIAMQSQEYIRRNTHILFQNSTCRSGSSSALSRLQIARSNAGHSSCRLSFRNRARSYSENFTHADADQNLKMSFIALSADKGAELQVWLFVNVI